MRQGALGIVASMAAKTGALGNFGFQPRAIDFGIRRREPCRPDILRYFSALKFLSVVIELSSNVRHTS